MNILSRIRSRGGEDCADVTVPANDTDVWVKWHYGSLYAFYVLLAISTVIAQFNGGMTNGERFIALGLSLLLCGWHHVMVFRQSEYIYRNNRNTPAIFIYFVVVLLLLAPMISINPAYNFMAFIVFWQNFTLWTLWFAVPGALVLSVYMTWVNLDADAPLATLLSPQTFTYFLISFPVSVALSLFIAAIIRQSHERQRLIDELESTRADLAAEERRAGMLSERDRLAKEIHDTLAQGFISIVTHLEASEESTPEEARRHIEQAKRTSRENLVEARRLVAALRPEILEGSSLPDALFRLCSSWSEASGVPARFELTGEESQLSQDTQVALLRAAQEALSNARRHSGATEVNVTLSYADDLILLDVQDDGRGFDPSDCERTGDGGFGLRAMRERIESLGGELSVESKSGSGTTIALKMPIVAEVTGTEEIRR
ncbi:MAG: sensor histidine kinase [Rubrobacter sp.]